MGTERQSPDALLSETGHSSCVLSDLTSDPDTGDANWCVATNNNTSTEVHCSFPTPTGNPTTGAGVQEFRAEVRRTSGSGTSDPQARIELWENGTLVTAGTDTTVTSDTSQVLSFTWDASSLGTADGSLVEVKVIGTKSGGSPSARSAVDIGGVEWNVTYDEGTTPVSNTIDARWAIDEEVSQTSDLRWAIDAEVSNPLDLRWRIDSEISNTLDLRWAIDTEVSNALDLQWALDGEASNTLDLQWVMDAEVSSALDLRWAIGGAAVVKKRVGVIIRTGVVVGCVHPIVCYG